MTDLELARHLAGIADELSLHYWGTRVAVDYKADGSFVTTADLAVDAAIREELASQRPDDAVLTEESGASGVTGASRRWLIDPLDGTSWFVDRAPHWGVHVSLLIDGVVVVTVVSRPVFGRTWFAASGLGGFRTDGESVTRLQVTSTSSLAAARISGYVGYWAPVVDRVERCATWVHDPSPTLALLDGRIDAVVGEGGYPWDLAPAALLVPEAGGRFTDPGGGMRLDARASVASNGVLHDAVCGLAWPNR